MTKMFPEVHTNQKPGIGLPKNVVYLRIITLDSRQMRWYLWKFKYRQNKNNLGLSQSISQIRKMKYWIQWLLCGDRGCPSDTFQVPSHGNGKKPNAPIYYRQDPSLNKSVKKSDRIYKKKINLVVPQIKFTKSYLLNVRPYLKQSKTQWL